MPQTCSIASKPALWGTILALLALVAGAAPPANPSANPPAARATSAETETDNDAQRKAEVLAGSRWRRAMHELDEWLAAQPIYSPDRVQRIKNDLATRTAGMTSYELEYMLEGLDEKLHILESPEATEAREWLGRYLAVMADDRRAALLADVPDVLEMSAADLTTKLTEIEEKRTKVERGARESRRSRQEFGGFIDDARRAEVADRAQLRLIRRGDAAFSPYRGQPVGSPPFPDSFDSPTVVGVGPWTSFVDHSFAAF
jgi:hypothetical protein